MPRTGPAADNQANQSGEASSSDRQRVLTWAQCLKRVFAIDIETCRSCGGPLRVIGSIKDPPVIERILGHLGGDGESADPAHLSRARPRATCWSDRFVILINTRAAVRDGRVLARDGVRRHFRRKGEIHMPE